ncbi:hypothetical protein CRG98_024338 [Punica granatum]|uniref:Uncharacterized protein n=1 Tax=Punica granatum TaxID=22663 RepID=A0A2I0JGE8_PUNGR|nr:hypothetical protein CRG98_024338 [Punica granatum]
MESVVDEAIVGEGLEESLAEEADDLALLPIKVDRKELDDAIEDLLGAVEGGQGRRGWRMSGGGWPNKGGSGVATTALKWPLGLGSLVRTKEDRESIMKIPKECRHSPTCRKMFSQNGASYHGKGFTYVFLDSISVFAQIL